uniref:F-box domain-containing protein n=1 Tax=Ditylenchus dipsaci TaxID=166011 RepID=A0A915E517_9BILA
MLFPGEVLRDIFAFSGGNDLDDLLLVNQQFSAIVSRFYSTNRPVRRMFSLDVDFAFFSTVQYEHRKQTKKSFVNFKALMDAIRRDPIEIANIRLKRGTDPSCPSFQCAKRQICVPCQNALLQIGQGKRTSIHQTIGASQEKNYSNMVKSFFNKRPKSIESYFLCIPHGIPCNKIEVDVDSIDLRISANFIKSGHLWSKPGQSSLIIMNRYLFQEEPEELVDSLLMSFNAADKRSNYTIVVKEMADLAEFSIATQFNQRTKERFETSMLEKAAIDDSRVEFSSDRASKYWVIRRSPMQSEE